MSDRRSRPCRRSPRGAGGQLESSLAPRPAGRGALAVAIRAGKWQLSDATGRFPSYAAIRAPPPRASGSVVTQSVRSRNVRRSCCGVAPARPCDVLVGEAVTGWLPALAGLFREDARRLRPRWRPDGGVRPVAAPRAPGARSCGRPRRRSRGGRRPHARVHARSGRAGATVNLESRSCGNEALPSPHGRRRSTLLLCPEDG